MTESEEAKAALAALADAEPTAGGRNRQRDDACETPVEASVQATDRPVDSVGRDADYRTVIERAVAATGDLAAAAAFVDSVGLDRLEAAVEQAEHEVSGLAEEGRDALVTFERFRVAAAGPVSE